MISDHLDLKNDTGKKQRVISKNKYNRLVRDANIDTKNHWSKRKNSSNLVGGGGGGRSKNEKQKLTHASGAYSIFIHTTLTLTKEEE